MNWIDIACITCLLICGIIGLWRGLLSSVFRLCAWITAILGAYFSQDLLGDFFIRNFAFGEFTARLICICIGFLVPFLLFIFIEHLVGDSIKNTIVGKTNHILGMLFGFIKAALISFVLLSILHILPVDGNLKKTRNDSFVYNIYKSSLETISDSSDEVNLRKIAKEKASELTKTIMDKAKSSTEQTADSAKAAVKDAVSEMANKANNTAAKAKNAAEAAKDAAIKALDESRSSAFNDSSNVK